MKIGFWRQKILKVNSSGIKFILIIWLMSSKCLLRTSRSNGDKNTNAFRKNYKQCKVNLTEKVYKWRKKIFFWTNLLLDNDFDDIFDDIHNNIDNLTF